MISIVISSANKTLLARVTLNISATIGVPYELISIDNSNGAMGICEVYNLGAEQARYQTICYMHEDILLHTKDWGVEVMRVFSNHPDVGIVGVAGGAYKPYAPSGWAGISYESKTIFTNYLQTDKAGLHPPVAHQVNIGDGHPADVVCVDGMWFCTRRDLALSYPFDSELLKGFHGYDIDFCLTVGQHKRVVVCFSILLEHFSNGGYSKSWLSDTLKVHDKWGKILPRSILPLSERNRQLIEMRSYKWLVAKMTEMGYSIAYITAFLYPYFTKGRVTVKQFFKLIYYAMRYQFKSA